MGIIDKAKPISEVAKSNLWVVYGRSGTGKTKFISTLPKPIVYARIGDDGSHTIEDVEDIDLVEIANVDDLKTFAKEAVKDKNYASIVVDTFSLYTTEWQNQKVTQKGKRMTQQLWGDLKSDTEDIIKELARAAKTHVVALTCHEATDSIEGMEDEIAPDVRPSVSKGARTYLEGMANFGIHTVKIEKEVTKGNSTREVVKYAADIGPNPYYWTKFQISSDIKLPKRLINPTYDKIMELIGRVER